MFYKNYVHVTGRRETLEYETKPLVGIQAGHGEMIGPEDKLATYGFIQAELSKMLGKVLTTIDATFSDPTQRKAVKDIIKGHFGDEFAFVGEFLVDQGAAEEAANRYFAANPDVEPEPVDIAVAMGIEKVS